MAVAKKGEAGGGGEGGGSGRTSRGIPWFSRVNLAIYVYTRRHKEYTVYNRFYCFGRTIVFLRTPKV